MKPQPTGNDFAAFIGIDWADAKHDICLQTAHAARRESSILPHRPDAIEAWTGTLRQRFQGQPIAVPRARQGPARLCPAEVRLSGALPGQPRNAGQVSPSLHPEPGQG